MRRRVAAFIEPGDAEQCLPEASLAPEGGVPLADNMAARKALTKALLRLDDDGEAAREVARITARRPGLAPLATGPDLNLALRAAVERFPANLSLRMALAEALSDRGDADSARTLAISVIRDARGAVGAPTTGERAPRDRTPFEDPAHNGTFFHSVDADDFFIEGEPKNALVTAREALRLHWPNLAGKTVLDVGSYGGWYAFEAERRGAGAVTANDFYAWQTNYPEMWRWVVEHQERGIAPDVYAAPWPCLDPEGQPGRRLFDLTHEALGSRVKPLFGKIDDVAVEPHDVMLLLGVLYHHENPLALLRRAFSLTRETLVIETLSYEYAGLEDEPLWHVYHPRDARADATTVWAPNAAGLRDALLKVGFSRVDLLYGWDSDGFAPGQKAMECRLWAHAHR